MSEALEVAAEITKLSRLLGVGEGELQFLARLPSVALQQFRFSATDVLFDGDRAQLGRVAGSSKLVPIPMAAKVAQLAFGPTLCAAVSGLLEPERGMKTAIRMPTPFLADVAADMDPRRAEAVIAIMPADTVVAVGCELVGRGDYLTMGRFVGYLPETTLGPAVAAIGAADLLRIAFVLEDKGRLDVLADLVQHRMADLIDAAHADGLWPEALDLLNQLNEDHRRLAHAVVAAYLAVLPDESLDALVAVLDGDTALDTWQTVGEFAGETPDRLRPKLIQRALALGLDELARQLQKTD